MLTCLGKSPSVKPNTSTKGAELVHDQADGADELLTPAEAAKAMRVSVPTLTRWARRGDIESIELPGGTRRYKRSVVDAILNGSPATASA
jgi:excisionase family DNA binding protein